MARIAVLGASVGAADGLNAAISLARDGHETILLSNICDDAVGRNVMRQLDVEAIDNSYMNFVPESMLMRYNNIVAHDLDYAQPDWLYVAGLRGDLATLEQFIKKAMELKTKVILMPGTEELAQRWRFLRLLGMAEVLMIDTIGAACLVPGNTARELEYRLNNYVPVTIVTDASVGGKAAIHKMQIDKLRAII